MSGLAFDTATNKWLPFSSGWTDSRDFSGLDPTGTVNCAVELNAAFDQVITAGYGLYLQPGTYMIGAPGGLVKSGLHLRGAAGYRTTLIMPPDGYVGAIFGTGQDASADDVVFEDLVFDGQQQSRTISTGSSLLKAYKAKRWSLKRVIIKNSTSYGFGWQGYPGNADPDKQDVALDLHMEDCRLHDCGWLHGTLGTPRSGTSNSSDCADIKSSERVLLERCYFAYGSNPGLDLRCRRGTLLECSFEGNVGAGTEIASHRPTLTWTTATVYAVSDNVDQAGLVYTCLVAHTSGVFATDLAAGKWLLLGDLEEWPDNDAFVTVVGGRAKDNIGSGYAVSSSVGGASVTHANLIGVEARGNSGSGYACNQPVGGLHVSVLGGFFNKNAVCGISLVGVTQLSIIGAQCCGNTLDGISLVNQDGGAIIGNICRNNVGRGIFTGGTSDLLYIKGNDVRNNALALSLIGVNTIATENRTGAAALPNVASATNITLPVDSDFITISGTTTIATVARSWIGRMVTLYFISGCQLTFSSSMILAGGVHFVATASDTITLRCLNVNAWAEVARSVN